jgi:hypothetical protein
MKRQSPKKRKVVATVDAGEIHILFAVHLGRYLVLNSLNPTLSIDGIIM